jgi:hypothetical protein
MFPSSDYIRKTFFRYTQWEKIKVQTTARTKHPDWRLGNPPSFLFNRKLEPFPQGQNSCITNLTIYLHLELRLKMHGAKS